LDNAVTVNSVMLNKAVNVKRRNSNLCRQY